MKVVFATIISIIGLMSFASSVWANSFGFHILDPSEIEYVIPFRGESEQFFITVPLSIYDRRVAEWEAFSDLAHKYKITPLVRWTTRFSDGAWIQPNRKDIVEAAAFFSALDWKQDRILILFNEPNHAPEWGGVIDPEGYVELAEFSLLWLKTEPVAYTILPAGLDGDAPNVEGKLMDNLTFFRRMHEHRPDFFERIDGLVSHAYPNPAFSATAYRTGKNSLRGFEYEWDLIRQLTGRELSIYITETGWKQSVYVGRLLPAYYRYAMTNIWNDERIEAVTFFLLRATSGPFADFSFLTQDGLPTAQMRALLTALEAQSQE